MSVAARLRHSRGVQSRMRALGLFLLTVQCACRVDTVQPGYYADPDAGLLKPLEQPMAAVPAPVLLPPMLESAGSGAPLLSDSAGAPSPVVTVGSPAEAGATAPAPSAEVSRCDLTGQWLITRHGVADGLGQLQTAHSWLYYEIQQTGDSFTVSKGLQCGEEVVAKTLLGANVDFSAAWDAITLHNADAGLTGKSVATDAGCTVAFETAYALRGLTVSYYKDPSTPLPTANNSVQARDGMPGWEDWDADGQPGITGVVSGAAIGKLYAVIRGSSTMTGSVSDVSRSFTLSDDWTQEENPLGFEGSSLVTTQGVRAADPALHFAQLARLDPGQISGDDLEICRGVRALAPSLTPEASGL